MSSDIVHELIYLAMFEASDVPYIVTDSDLVTIEANRAYQRRTGVPLSALVDHNLFDVLHEQKRSPVYQIGALRDSMERAIRNAQTDRLIGQPFASAAGHNPAETRYCNVISIPVVNSAGATVLLLSYIQDITASPDPQTDLTAIIGSSTDGQSATAVDAGDVRVQQNISERDEIHALDTEHYRRVALTLQRALVTSLPDPNELHMAARYRAADEFNEVGGDWYDAVSSRLDETSVVIGDVAGHGIDAAATMGQLRSMTRTLLGDRQAPSHTLSRLDGKMRDLHMATLATALVATIELASDTSCSTSAIVWWSNAGHPPPIIVTPAGDTIVLTGDRCDLLLGVAPDESRHDHRHELAPGSSLLLYTDGLIETRYQDLDQGIARLRTALGTHRALHPEALLDALLAEMLDTTSEDDVAVLLIRYQPFSTRPSSRLSNTALDSRPAPTNRLLQRHFFRTASAIGSSKQQRQNEPDATPDREQTVDASIQPPIPTV